MAINSDGSISLDRNGCRGLIRNNEGTVLLMFTGNGGDNSILSQELHGILAGLEGSLLLGKDKAVLSCDSSHAIAIANGLLSRPWNLARIANGIRAKLRNFNSLDLSTK